MFAPSPKNCLMAQLNSMNQLQPPGAGLPGFENFILNGLFKTGSALMSDKRAVKIFEREAAELYRMVNEEDESYDIFQPLLIPRVIGIEDSSRNWSVMMILDHLNAVNLDFLKIVNALTSGIVPRGEIDVALYKPSRELDYDTIVQFNEINAQYVQTIEGLIEKHGNLRSIARYAHPWFGPLDAHQWHCLAGIHQRIHRRQATKLIAMLGVV